MTRKHSHWTMDDTMTSARLAIAGVLAALFTVLGAGAAQAYPDPTITINGGRLVGGGTFEFTAQSGGVVCDTFTVTYRGETRTGSGTTFSGSFTTPPVTKITDTTVSATCQYVSVGATGGAVASASAVVTLLPVGADLAPAAVDTGSNTPSGALSGILPNTGGSSLWILVVGGALVLIGGGTFVVARRR